MSLEPPGLPPAGWYPDPERPDGPLRRWNGRSWDPVWQPTSGHPDLPEIGAWLGRSFSSMWRHWRSLLVIGLVTTVPAGVLGSVGIRYLFNGVAIIDDEVLGWESSRLAPAIALWLVAVLLGTLATLASAWLMLRAHDAASEPLAVTTDAELRAAGRALTAGAASLPRAIAWGLAVAVGVLIALFVLVVVYIVAWPLGLLLTVALLPVCCWLVIRWAFVLQAIVDGPGNPFRRSMEVSYDRFWPVCGRILLIGVIAWGMSFAGNMIVAATGGGFGSRVDVDDDYIDLGAAIGPSTLAIVLTTVVTAASAVFVTGTATAALAELYRTRNPASSGR